MLKIAPEYIAEVELATRIDDLFNAMQNAIMLEHATLPTYLTALFSIKPETNSEIVWVLKSIVIEEMMHMSIACNVLNALGGAPAINIRGFIPTFPGPLPMGIGDNPNKLTVTLEKYSKNQVHDIFMRIEEPEDPLVFKAGVRMNEFVQPEFRTIGEFYTAVQNKIKEVCPERLPGDPAKQFVSRSYPPDQLFGVTTKEEAIKALEIIIRQGEGTSTSPLDGDNPGDYAHYYKFEELYRGRRLMKDGSAPNGYSFTGEPIPFDENDVFNFHPNTKAKDIPEGMEGRRLINQFNFVYAKLLNALHRTFNGEPAFFDNALGLMYDLKLIAARLGTMDHPGGEGYKIGPSFEYVDINT